MEIMIVDENYDGRRVVEIIKDGEKIQALEISSYADAAIDIGVIKSLLEEVYKAGRKKDSFHISVHTSS